MGKWFRKNVELANTTPEEAAALRAEASDPRTPVSRLYQLAKDRRVAALVAANAATPPRLLAGLVNNAGDEERRAATANPNTPPDLLLELAASFPNELFANPVLPLLLLEQPTFFHSLGKDAYKLMQHPAAPPLLLASLTTHRDAGIALAAALHINLAGEAGPGWRQQVEEATWLIDADVSWNHHAFMTIVRRREAAEWLLPPLVLYGDQELRRAVAKSYEPLPACLRPFRRAGAARNLCDYSPPDPTLDPGLLERLARGSHWARTLVARHPNTPQALLDRLARGTDRGMRRLCAGHPHASEVLLSELARDGKLELRLTIARNHAAPAGLLLQLAADAHHSVRTLVAQHRAAPDEALARLASDPDWRVRKALAARPALPDALVELLAEDRERSVLYALARRSDLTSALLEQLGASEDPVVRHLVARHPATPSALRERLYAELGVTPLEQRPRADPAPPEHLDRRAPRAGDSVRARLRPQQNGATGEAARSAHDPTLGEAFAALLRIATYRYNNLAGPLALAYPGIGTAALREHLATPGWIQRYAIVSNPSTPRELLEVLAQDANSLVRAAAREALARRAASEEAL